MPVTSGGLMGGGRMLQRQARPLNGKEVAEAIESHLLDLATKILNAQQFYSDLVVELIEAFKQEIGDGLLVRPELYKVNVRYPKVGWQIRVRLEMDDREHFRLSGEVELDLERNKRFNLPIGQSGIGRVINVQEDERIATDTPDKMRRQFGIPVTAEFAKPNGDIVTVALDQVINERRAARTVDVGKARVEGQEVSQGAEVILPKDLPQVSLDDILAEPVLPTTEPRSEPLPEAGSMAKETRPKARMK